MDGMKEKHKDRWAMGLYLQQGKLFVYIANDFTALKVVTIYNLHL
jgi:hypothetical protein